MVTGQNVFVFCITIWYHNRSCLSESVWLFKMCVKMCLESDSVLAYRAANGSGLSYIQDMVKPYTPAHPLRSATAKRLATPSLRARHSHHSTKSRLFAVLAPQCWNELPIDIRSAETLHTLRCRLTTLFRLHFSPWRKKHTNKTNKQKKHFSSSPFLM